MSQLTLFDDFNPHKSSDELMGVLDSLNSSGKGNMWFAGQGVQNKLNEWKMRPDKLSPSWTTKCSDLLRVHC